MSEYTQGVVADGAAILKDGQPLTIEQVLEALREREALAAHVKRLTEALNHSMLDWIICGMATNGRLKEDGPMAMYQELKNALADNPASSLTHRDALKQAEALENLYNDIQRQNTGGMIRQGILLDRAIELRQQVEDQQ
ncbi:hypothetical protein [Vreelandella venusta]|uniref:Uncharacterized protein n=1 Tax=Vreelandella venusta TaxID=44935 RepID=A0ABX2B9S8_9GAMM|nr:hypothetical protein [Halomonas venusta]AZM95848.1 hypothetical protein EI420_09195 [Halomonas venusta]NPT30875.1 hypothetical protein [Halomonas venusta]UPT53244.1 hypothetical protein [Synechococcus phage Yong-L1-251]UQI42485.1 hypothetical protein M3L73_09565 [Halomonas venusta]